MNLLMELKCSNFVRLLCPRGLVIGEVKQAQTFLEFRLQLYLRLEYPRLLQLLELLLRYLNLY